METTEFNPSTQNGEILKYLQQGNAITYLEALNLFGVLFLPRRIKDLKQHGYNISDKFIAVVKKNGKTTHVKKYYLDQFSDIHK